MTRPHLSTAVAGSLAALLASCAVNGPSTATPSTAPPSSDLDRPRIPQPDPRAEATDVEEVAAELANPLSPITTLAAQFRGEFGLGPENDSNHQVRLQPSFFVPFEDGAAILVRTILPVRFNDWPASEAGLGDLSIIPYYVPDTRAANFVGYGAALGFDTASDDSLGSGRTTAGPAVLFAATGQPVTFGGLFQHVWSVDNSSTRADVDVTTAQPFVTMLLGAGWATTLNSEVTYNWNADPDDAWTVPVAAGVSRVVRFGGQYVSLALAYVQYLERPSFSPDWEMRLNLTYVLR